ncbi:MAG TPA: flagellar motor switch protein FliN [Thermoguttaceae bacterium]|nr:flagellar motor switch protein FliN [Thermoguttaceae bacterium]
MADELVNQDEIEQLLQRRQSSKQDSPDEAQQGRPQADTPSDDPLSQSDIETLLSKGGQGATGSSASTSRASRASDSPGRKSTDEGLQQADIDRLLNQAGAGSSPAQASPAPASAGHKAAAPSGAGESAMGQADIEYLLNQAERALESIDSETGASIPPGVAPFEFEQFLGEPASTESATLDLISNVQLDVKIELGRTDMYLEDVLKLRKGSVVPLDKLAGDPVDIYVNERLIARGEVLVLNDNFCVRVGELIAGSNAGS